MEFSASQVHEAESQVGDQLESEVGIDGCPLERRVVDERDIAPPVGAEPVEQRCEDLGAEWVVEIDNQVATRKGEGGRSSAHEANVAAGQFPAIRRPIVLGDLEQRRRDLDADDLAVRTPRGVQHHAAKSGADVHQGRTFGRERDRIE